MKPFFSPPKTLPFALLLSSTLAHGSTDFESSFHNFEQWQLKTKTFTDICLLDSPVFSKHPKKFTQDEFFYLWTREFNELTSCKDYLDPKQLHTLNRELNRQEAKRGFDFEAADPEFKNKKHPEGQAPPKFG